MTHLQKFEKCMKDTYGPFPTEAESWIPAPNPAGHKGRYLYTDAIAVVNFLTLYNEKRGEPNATYYLDLAKRLVRVVHSTLGYTRDGSSRLPGATDAEPLKGGLRIGKIDAEGPEGDGQYHHYLTLWMFALNRLSVASGQTVYNDQALSLAKAIHPNFIIDGTGSEPKLIWKMSVDLKKTLNKLESGWDATQGYVVFKILQVTAESQHGIKNVLDEEIKIYKKIIDRNNNGSSDSLDIGITMWTMSWCKEPWSVKVLNLCQERICNFLTIIDCSSLILLGQLYVQSKYFHRPVTIRSAFREFGACFGAKCSLVLAKDTERRDILKACSEHLLNYWEERVHDPGNVFFLLKPITMVMYAAALIPGGK
jgi:hypothetical protein